MFASACDARVGVGNTPTVDRSALQTDIANRLAAAGAKPQSVTCGEDLLGEVGKTARCEVVMGPTNSFEPVVTVTGVAGDAINYEMRPALSEQQLARAVSRLVADATHAPVASVRCESGLDGRVGATAHCAVASSGQELRRTVEVTSVEGLMMNFDVVPVLTSDEVADSLLDDLRQQTGQRPDSARCAGDLEGKPGNTVDCTVATGTVTSDFRLTVTTVRNGSIEYSYAPKP
jgi:hypothetical protein